MEMTKSDKDNSNYLPIFNTIDLKLFKLKGGKTFYTYMKILYLRQLSV